MSLSSKRRWPIQVEQVINAPIEEVWKLISKPGHGELWHPFCDSHQAPEDWGGPGAKDTVIYYSGIHLERLVSRWEDGLGYELQVENEKGARSIVRWDLQSISSSQTKLKFTVLSEALDKLPLPFRWVLHHLKLKPVFSDYLRKAGQGLAYYAIHREKVKKNQFGTHPIFSPGGSRI